MLILTCYGTLVNSIFKYHVLICGNILSLRERSIFNISLERHALFQVSYVLISEGKIC